MTKITKMCGYEVEEVDKNERVGIGRNLGDTIWYIKYGEKPIVHIEEKGILYKMTNKSIEELIKNNGRVAIIRKNKNGN